MLKPHPEHIRANLDKARELHDRAVSDYSKCLEFNKLMGEILDQLEDVGDLDMADKVMALLLDCNPKEGTKCEKATMIGDKVKKF